MIHGNHSTLQMPAWQNQLAQAVRDPKQLLTALDLPMRYLDSIEEAHQIFPLRVTKSYLNRMEKGNINDPLLRQILPARSEAEKVIGFSNDPVGDKLAEAIPGLLHKYKNRVLLTLTGACGIHCRYCFRRHYDYANSNPIKHWPDNLTYIKNNTTIREVIFSGGDPLSLNDQRLAKLVDELSAIPHLKTLRIHTRQIIALPDRVNEALLEWTKHSRLKVVFVLHTNHPNEIDLDVKQALSRLTNIGATLLNQSVLLRGVNDSAQVLTELSEKLFSANVIPYYLHMLDKVAGSAHFEVKQSTAVELINTLRKELPGYLVPRLVRDLPDTGHKSTIEA
ncbi:MAG TPA: EF-P beta-lysylation protein EpmB [Gammaproteobacteria bacterium]|nr:EF-P beta-lysylation protein EpmB [Gammaproteobacteria bacterium]